MADQLAQSPRLVGGIIEVPMESKLQLQLVELACDALKPRLAADQRMLGPIRPRLMLCGCQPIVSNSRSPSTANIMRLRSRSCAGHDLP